MCDTLTNISSIEDNQSYVLTQDMFDAAMTEQFTYQDEIESEEELTSPNDNMDLDADVHSSNFISDNKSSDLSYTNQGLSSVEYDLKRKTENSDTITGSVLVIQTGLDKIFRRENENVADNEEVHVLEVERVSNETDNGVNVQSSDSIEGNQLQSDDNTKTPTNTQSGSSESINGNSVHLLKKMLSQPKKIESIDLCDSDETSSENEMSAVELIDNELKSVMESNLMAEVGMAINKKSDSKSVQPCSPPPNNSSPKIMVESVTQISPNAFHSGMWNVNSTNKTNYNATNINNQGMNYVNIKPKSNMIITKNQAPSSIHINKIAIPNRNFMDTKNKMKCIFLKNQTGSQVDVVINNNQPPISNKRTKFMTQPIKKSIQLSPMEALKNVTQRHMQSYQPVMPKPSFDKQTKPNSVLSVKQIAPRLQKVPTVQNNLSKPTQRQNPQDLERESLIKSLLFHTLKMPYVPPEVPFGDETYPCSDCKDRFVVQSSLNHHLARRSLVISYWCSHCRADLIFYNRCVFLKHLRNHNYSIGQLNFSDIMVSPLPKQMVDNGVISKFFSKDSSTTQAAFVQSKIGKDQLDKFELTKKSNSSIVFIEKPMSSTGQFNPSNQKLYGKLNTGLSHSRVVGSQLQPTLLLNTQPGNSTSVYSSNSLSPPHTSPSVPRFVVQNSQTQTNSDFTGLQKITPKSVVLYCNKPPDSVYTNQNIVATSNALPPNEMFVVSENENMLIEKNDDVTNKPTIVVEDEEIDVESVTVDDEIPSNALYRIPNLKKERNSNGKSKAKCLPSELSKPLKRTCPECGVQCFNISRHLSGNNRPLNPVFTCKTCQLILPTNCALKVHSRIHLKLPPYKCPDCGKDFTVWQELNAHLKFSCGHFAKCVRFMCAACKAHFPSEVVLGHHISMQHARDIFRCSLCPVAFYNKNSLDKHVSTNHPNELAEGTNQKQCSLCPKKLVPLNDFSTHIQEHTRSNASLIYGFKCPMCSVVFANKMAFIIHQIKEKKEMERIEVNAPKVSGPTHAKSLSTLVDEKLFNHVEKKENTNVPESVQISDSEPEMEEENDIFGKLQETGGDYPSVAEKDPLSLDGWEISQEQRVKEKREELCIVCKKNCVYILPEININEQSLCCKQCVKPLGIGSALVNGNTQTVDNQEWSVNQANSDKPVEPTNGKWLQKHSSKKRKTISETFPKDGSYESEKKIESYSENGPLKKKVRKKKNKYQSDIAGQPYIKGQVIACKSSREMICSKCGFVAGTKKTFLEHIKVHRTDPHTYQCLECGLCFVVLPSLERHLQMHGIKDVHEYINNNKYSMPQKSAPVEQAVLLKDNQCRVCFKLCDSPTNLEKHFRTHGMAFMNSLSKSP